MKTVFISLIISTLSIAVYAQIEVVTPDATTAAGIFRIKNVNSTKDALTGITNGGGIGVVGANTAPDGIQIGLKGTSSSSTHGLGASVGVTGVLGEINSNSPGGYSAAVRGVNNGTGVLGIGTIGYHAGSGWGIYGESSKGWGVYGLSTDNSAYSIGVRGETFSANGIGVEAKYAGQGVGTALEIDNGAIRVAGVFKSAFVHTATVGNKLSANGTDIDNPLCNGDPDCLLFVTQRMISSGPTYNNSPIGVFYNSVRQKWEIFNQNNTVIPTNAKFNVLVIKQ
ncbi:DUF7452 domain-containing protein [Emticicia fontis]